MTRESALVTSFIKSPRRSAQVKSSALPLRALSPGIPQFCSQMSRRLPWTPKREETFVKSFEAKWMSMEELLSW